MFISNYNSLACQFINNFDFCKSPAVSIILGKEGLGKTTLLDYLAQKLRNENIDFISIDAQKFASKYSFASYSGDLSAFRKYFRTTKLLILDNIDLLKGKTKTIEELFHTLDTIFVQGGKAVISYNGNNLDLKYLGERFASRINTGLVIRLNEPTSQEINQFVNYYLKSINKDTNLQDPSLTSAGNFKIVINKINKSLAKTSDCNDDLLEPEESLEKHVSIILNLVSHYFDIEKQEVLGSSKKNNCVRARYLMFTLLNEKFNHSYKQIADYFTKDLNSIKHRSSKIKDANSDQFETLCQKLYNQLNY